MKKLKELYQQSLQELCHTKTVVLCGLLAALAIVLSMVASIQLGPYIKIGFSGLPSCHQKRDHAADRQFYPVLCADLCEKDCGTVWIFHGKIRREGTCLMGKI